jgi:hypothetical protein
MKTLAATLLVVCCGACHSEELLKVSRTAWEGLSADERTSIQAGRLVDVRDAGTFGLVTDNQGVNESTPGTTAGAAVGGSLAEAAYIDHAFKPGNNYSAKNQLAVGILGAIVGSTLDKPAVQQFHFRYAVKLENGELKTLDSVQPSPFRHPVGLCVSVPDLAQLPQGLCTNTAADLRRIYVAGAPTTTSSITGAQQGANPGVVSTAPAPGAVMCKLGNLAPVSTSEAKCKAIGGEVL